jgi:signal peptide peptidase SppA
LKLPDLLNSPWAIQPEKLSEILAIYAAHVRGEQIDVKAVEARLGRTLANEQKEYTVREGGVAVLAVEGVIAQKANLFTAISGGASAQMLQTQVESAIADPAVKGLVLQIDSPGGSALGSPELAAVVRQLSEQKPIVAVSDGLMASAAYWIGSAANALYVTGPTVHVGSIGVVVAHQYDPRGANTTEISAGKYKRIASTNAPLTSEGRAHLQERVDHIYSVFVDAVAANRGVSAEQVLEDMADGRLFIGQQAVDAGLVNGIESLDAIAERMATDPGHFTKRRGAKPRAVTTKSPAAAPKATTPIVISLERKGSAMDRKQLETEHPALFAELRDGFRAEGATAERERIQAVENAALPGHEKLIASLKFDGKTDGGTAALAVLAAEKTKLGAAAATLSADAPAPVKPAATPAVEQPAKTDLMADKSKPIDERCKATWEGSAEIRAEFGSLAAFTAFSRAQEAGQVRMLSKRAA